MSRVLARFQADYPNLVDHLRTLLVHRGRPPGGRLCKEITAALTVSAWTEYADLPYFAPIVLISPSKDIRVGCIATEEHALGDGMATRYDDYNPVMYLAKTGKVGSLSYRRKAFDELIAFLGDDPKTSALLLDATHGESSIRREVILEGNLLPPSDIIGAADEARDTTPSIALFLSSGNRDDAGGAVYAKVGYFPLWMHEDKALVVGERFLPCGTEGTPEHGAAGMDRMAAGGTLQDLVAAYGVQETIFALAEREANPLVVVTSTTDEKGGREQPTFSPLSGFTTDVVDRLRGF